MFDLSRVVVVDLQALFAQPLRERAHQQARPLAPQRHGHARTGADGQDGEPGRPGSACPFGTLPRQVQVVTAVTIDRYNDLNPLLVDTERITTC